ncbi:MAG TPA: hypothetical protein VGE07_10565 [Herpetosiphonaceae bacterium]
MLRKLWLARVWMLLSVVAVFPPAHAAHAQAERCFPETSHCISGRFRAYWEQHGGLAVFGYPISPDYQQLNRDTNQRYLTQWFERTRFELHSENQPPYDVLLGRLGDDALQTGGRQWRDLPVAPQAQQNCLWFAQTQHNLCDQAPGRGFRHYWERHGLEFDGRPGASYAESLALFGLPLSEPALETNAAGDTVLTQWFERARFEWHPANPDDFKVLLGLIGGEVLFPFQHQANPSLAGTVAFTSQLGPASATYRMHADGDQIRPVAPKEEEYLAQAALGFNTALSPDKTRLALQMRYQGASGLYVVDRLTGGVTRINADPTAQPLDWSPDGARIVYLSGLEERLGLYVVGSGGGSEIRLTASRPGEMPTQADWSPAGDRIAYDAQQAGSFVINADGSGRRALPAEVEYPRWMPDGKLIVYSVPDYQPNPGVYLIDPAGSQPRTFIKDPVYPEFSPDGRYLSFIRYTGAETALYAMDIDGTHERKLLASADGRLGGPMMLRNAIWSPDSQHLAVNFEACATNEVEEWVCTRSAVLAVRQDGRESFPLLRRDNGKLTVTEWLAD